MLDERKTKEEKEELKFPLETNKLVQSQNEELRKDKKFALQYETDRHFKKKN